MPGTGDERDRALEQAFADHAAVLRRVAAALLRGTGADPDDVVQDVFLRAHVALGRSDAAQDRAYLLTMLRNRCIDERRSLARRPVPASDAAECSSGAATADAAQQAIDRERLREALADIQRLPDRQRRVLLARVLDGDAHDEVAEKLDLTTGQSRSLLSRAVANVRATRAARESPCAEIRTLLEAAARSGARPPERARRHLWTCAGCREAAPMRARSADRLRARVAAFVPGWVHLLAEPLAHLPALQAGGRAAVAAGAAATLALQPAPADDRPTAPPPSPARATVTAAAPKVVAPAEPVATTVQPGPTRDDGASRPTARVEVQTPEPAAVDPHARRLREADRRVLAAQSRAGQERYLSRLRAACAAGPQTAPTAVRDSCPQQASATPAPQPDPPATTEPDSGQPAASDAVPAA